MIKSGIIVDKSNEGMQKYYKKKLKQVNRDLEAYTRRPANLPSNKTIVAVMKNLHIQKSKLTKLIK